MGNVIGLAPEELLMKEIKQNTLWPFTEVSPNVYQLRKRNVQFYYAFILLAVNTVVMLYLYFVSGERTVMVINICIYGVLAYQIMNYYNERSCILLADKCMYQFYIGDSLAQESHYHNIYVRLSKQMAGDEKMLVKLVLDGYGIEPFELSKNSSNQSGMRTVGMKIARNLDLNFFDMQDVSRLHKIRHRCPQKTADGIYYRAQSLYLGDITSMFRLPGQSSKTSMKMTRSTNSLVPTGVDSLKPF